MLERLLLEKPFQSGLILENSTQVGSCFTQKFYTRLKSPARNKLSSLFPGSISDEENIYNFNDWWSLF
jgi:hypothetical protein